MADFRNPVRAAALTGTSNHNAEELLRPLVTCGAYDFLDRFGLSESLQGICMELYVDPVALLDCLHLACGSCAKEWLGQ